MRRAARGLVWLALGASLVVDGRWVEALWSHVMSPFAEPYNSWNWLTIIGGALAQSGLMWAEIQLRPPQPLQTLHLND